MQKLMDHHLFGDDDDRTFQLWESYHHCISDHPFACPPPPLLLPAPLGMEGGADPATAGSNSSSSHGGHCSVMMAAEDPAARRSGGANNNKSASGGGVKLSTDPQSVAARQRRHRISDRFKILKSLVPGGSKMDTVSMLEEAITYVKFLKAQIWLHQAALMLHPEDHIYRPPPMSFPTTNSMSAAAAAATASASTNINVAGNCDYASSFSSTRCSVLPDDHDWHSMYTAAAGDHEQQRQATANSVALPCCTFHEEEEMFRHGSRNY